MKLVEKYRKVDDEIREYRKLSVGVLHAIEPVNLNEAKKKFFEDFKDPEFIYPVVFFDPKDIIKKLSSLHIPEGELHDLYAEKVDELLNLANIVSNRGKREVVEYSIKVYGRPKDDVVREALRTIKKSRVNKPRNSATLPARNAMMTFERALENYHLHDWIVEYSNKSLVTVMPAERKILVPRSRFFSPKELKRLVVHEIGVHVLRAENGHHQPLSIFAGGFPKYTETEEGLAAYMEKFTGLLEDARLRNYAGRVLSVHYMLKGESFSEVFNRMKNLGFENEEAWVLTFRSFRGGGFTKDYLYFQGLLEIERISRKKKALQVLYTGKVCHDYFDLVLSMLENREINRPRVLPKGVRSLNKVENLLKNAETFISDILKTTRKVVADEEIKSKIASDISTALRKWKTAFWARV